MEHRVRRSVATAIVTLSGVLALAAPVGAQVDPTAPIDAADRAEVIEAYRDEVYLPDLAPPPLAWTGDVASCTPGTIGDAARASAIDRTNWYRRMAGLAPVTSDDGFTAQAQAAALNTIANPGLTHTPAPTSNCYTTAARDGSGRSNLGRGSGELDRRPVSVVDAWIDDAFNVFPGVGHRSGLLDPRIVKTGYGQVQVGRDWAAAQQWIPDSFADLVPRSVTGSGSVPAVPPTGQRAVAWPPSGFVPFAHAHRLWSLQYVGACFDDATITVTGPMGTVQPEPIDVGDSDCLGAGFLPESTLAWDMGPSFGLGELRQRPSVHPRPDGDVSYDVTVSGVDIDGVASSFSYTITVVDPLDFDDVGYDHPFFVEIAWMFSEGVSTGSVDPDGSGVVYLPDAAVKRQAMAAFLYRLAGSPEPVSSTPHFDDVGVGHPFFEAIQWMSEAGVSTGSPDPDGSGVVYLPDAVVKRQAMAAFLYRLAGSPEPVSSTPHFDDVGVGHPFFDAIQWMSEAGVSTGSPDPDGSGVVYQHQSDVKRQAMAAFLYRIDADRP